MEMLPRIVQCSPGVSRLWITPGKRKGRGGEKRERGRGRKGEKEEREEEERKKGRKEKRKKKSLDHGVKGLRAAYFMRLRRTY